MKLNGPLMRERRLQLGLTSRELADRAHCSITVIRRVEESGDVGTLTVATVAAMLDALSMRWEEALLELGDVESAPSDLVVRLGALLHTHAKGLPAQAAAAYLSVTLSEIVEALEGLSVALEPAGLRVHSGSTGLRIVAVPVRVDGAAEEARAFTVLNHADLSLLKRVSCGRVKSNTVARSNQGNVSLHKLRKCGLVSEEPGGVLVLTDRTRRTLGLA